MDLTKIKEGDRVIVRIPSKSANQVGTTEEATIVRIGLKRIAGVFRLLKSGALRTLPLVNVEGMSTDQTPVEQKAKPGEDAVVATLASVEAKLETEGAAAPTAEAPAPVAETKKETLAETTKNIQEYDETHQPGQKPADNVSMAVDVMQQANEASAQADKALKELKPSANKTTKTKKTLSPEERAARKESIRTLLLAGEKNKEISVKVECDPALVSDIKKAMIAAGELTVPEKAAPAPKAEAAAPEAQPAGVEAKKEGE